MLLMMPVRFHLGEVDVGEVVPAAGVNGARPLIGKANTEFRRAESNSVSRPCTNGDEADSAMKCGT